MKKRCLFSRGAFLLPLLLLAVVLISPVSAVEDVKPPITVVFRESVVIPFNAYIIENKDTGKIFEVDIVVPFNYDHQSTATKFEFRPKEALENGEYTFTVGAMDLVDNYEEYVKEFSIFMPNTLIRLLRPNSIGVSNTTDFDVIIETTRPAICKHRGIPFSDFDDDKVKFFDVTGNFSSSKYVFSHIIMDYHVDEGFSKRLYVACRDELGRTPFESFDLYSDTSPPRIVSVYFNPSPVVEYPVYGPLSSALNIGANEPAICRYTDDPDVAYGSMIPFSTYDQDDFNAYEELNIEYVLFADDVVKETFKYYMQCEDRARHRSEKVEREILVDLSAGLKIRVRSPPQFSNNPLVFLNITTNKRSYCSYKSPEPGEPNSYSDTGAQLSSFDALTTLHQKDLKKKSSGVHSLTIRCDVPEGVGFEADSAEMTYSYTIDTDPPMKPVVNATSPVCTNTLEATFWSNDSVSGISEYIWSVGTGKEVFNEGTTESDSVKVSDTMNGSSIILLKGGKYYFKVKAVDGADNIGPEGTSNEISFDETGLGCDTTPPTITVTKSETGQSVSIECTDDLSGCTSMGSFYGTAYVGTCNATQYYLPPVLIPLMRTITVCWEIKDVAGNVARGSKVIEFNSSSIFAEGGPCPDGIDNDGDGYGERCLLGPDCDDTDNLANIMCANGCIQDTDGDGYGPGCANGPDCDGYDPNLTVKCPNGCISDGDGDGYGLGCADGPDCKGTDSTLTTQCPSGCLDDNDGDGYGPSCPAGLDCQGEDANYRTDCGNDCIQDTDGDEFGIGCASGLDCAGRDPSRTTVCSNGCYFDEDQDGYGFGCTAGLDCNGLHYLLFEGCSNNCVSDNDGDGTGWECDRGDDCNDTNPYITFECHDTTECIVDHDGDGYGLGCEPGHDCDDYNFSVILDECEWKNCTYDEDCNGLPDPWQDEYFNDTVCDDPEFCGRDADPDGDGFTNIEEYRRGTNPLEKEDVRLPPEVAREAVDEDGDGIPDGCERLYGLDPDNPYDGSDDPDGDGLSNSFECNYKKGMCVNWLNPKNPDHDGDGYGDKDEIDAGTDPCDPDSHPSAGFIAILLLILGLLAVVGSTGYLVYKTYYIPLATPKPVTVAPAVAVRAARAAHVRRPTTHLRRHHVGPKKRSGPVTSHERFIEEQRKKAEKREKLFSTFGARRERPKKIMEKLARKHVARRKVPIAVVATAAAAKAAQPAPAQKEDYVSRLTGVIGGDYFDKLSGLSKKEADYMGKLAVITKQKDVPLEDDQVSKLARITQKVAPDASKQKELEKAFRKSEVDKLEEFLTSRKQVDTFIKEEVRKKDEPDAMEKLANITGGTDKGMDALSGLSTGKREDVMDALESLSGKKAEAVAAKMDQFASIESKDDLFKAFRKMSKETHIDKNVFSVLLSYLVKAGKINKRDVYDLMLDLEKQGVLDKTDVSEVFFNLGVKS